MITKVGTLIITEDEIFATGFEFDGQVCDGEGPDNVNKAVISYGVHILCKRLSGIIKQEPHRGTEKEAGQDA